jgi:transketolase
MSFEINEKNARGWSRLGPRANYGMALLTLTEENNDIIATSGDLVGSSGLERMRQKYPERIINAGIAEQNLIGISAGLAREGFIPFASSFAPFVSLRASEQIRMNLGYMQGNVKVVALGSGISMEHLGNSHFGLEDIAVMRAIPGLTILSPADASEIYKTVYAAAKHKGPVYIRLTGSVPIEAVYKNDYDFKIGKAVRLTLNEGKWKPADNAPGEKSEIAIFATGAILSKALKAANLLFERNIKADVYDFHTIKPLDEKTVRDSLDKKLIVTVEEHSVIGGLGSAVSDLISEIKNKPPVLKLGLPNTFLKSGKYDWLLEQYGLTPEKIAEKIAGKIA